MSSSSSAAARRRVALVAPPGAGALAEYLRAAGFDVHERDEIASPGSFAGLVIISPETSDDRYVADVGRWLAASSQPRVVVVTSRPAALRDLVADHGDRLRVLPAPAFGWDLVDALRPPG